MTRALHDRLIDIERDHDEDEEARILSRLSEEFLATAEQLTHDNAAQPEDIEDFTKAREQLTRHLGHLSLSELVADMDVAVAKDNPQELQTALDDLEARFPRDAANPGLARANIRTILDYEKAIELAKEKGTLVSNEIATAAALNDKEFGVDFDEVIAVSNWTVKEQDGKLDAKTQQDLDELRHREAKRLGELQRREEERKKLETLGENEDEDTQPLSPEEMRALLFDDDDDEDENLKNVA